MPRKADNIDLEILNILKENSRASNVAMARRIGISEGSIRQRIGKMKKNGMIKRFTLVTSSKGLQAIIEINIEVNVHTTKIAKMIKELDGVETVYEVSGDSDIVVIMDVPGTKELNDAIESVRAMENVVSTKTKLILGEL
mgnify:CR=1 FL=1